MAGVIDAKGLSLPLTLAASLLVSAVTGTAAAVASAYSLRDGLVERIDHEVEKSANQMRREKTEALSHYVSLDSFKDWQQQDRIRQDRQYFSLLNAIERLGDRQKR